MNRVASAVREPTKRPFSHKSQRTDLPAFYPRSATTVNLGPSVDAVRILVLDPRPLWGRHSDVDLLPRSTSGCVVDAERCQGRFNGSRCTEGVSRKSSENVRPKSQKSSKSPKAPQSPGIHEDLIPDKWDPEKGQNAQVSGGPTTEKNVDAAYSAAHKNHSTRCPWKMLAVRTKMKRRPCTGISRRPCRRSIEGRPDELNSKKEPFVKPGTMRAKAVPSQIAKGTRFSGHSSPMSKTFPAMSEQEVLSRVGPHVMMRQETAFKELIRVLVTAVTTELAYRMLVSLVRGDVFGVDQPIVRHLYDESEDISDMEGIA
ncbi:hypothetical protein MTO96_032635, partial [Rhipicephalus appendiculatus]